MEQAFRNVVENVFCNWSSLQICVENQSAGPCTKDLVKHFVDSMTTFCCTDSQQIVIEDIEVELLDILDEHFNVYCEDGSCKEVATVLYKFLQLLLQNKHEEFQMEFLKLPARVVPVQMSHKTATNETNGSSSSDNSEPMQDDDGWTVVKNKKSK